MAEANRGDLTPVLDVIDAPPGTPPLVVDVIDAPLGTPAPETDRG